MPVTGASSQGTVLPADYAGMKWTGLLGKHPAGNGSLDGGRNSLLESAQEATLISVATVTFSRQCNRLPQTIWQDALPSQIHMTPCQNNGLAGTCKFFYAKTPCASQKCSVPHLCCHPERSAAKSKDLLLAFSRAELGNLRPQPTAQPAIPSILMQTEPHPWIFFGLPGAMPTSPRRTMPPGPAFRRAWLPGPAIMAASSAT